MTAKWHASVSSSKRQDPDEKRVVSQRPHLTTDPFQYSTNQRSWSVLNDRTTNYGLDLSLPVGSTKLKAGAQVEYKRTNFQIAYLNIVADYGTPQSFYSLPLDSVYAPENFGRRKWLLQSGSVASDSYEGDQSITGGYLMADLPFELLSQRFRLTGGVRVEAFEQTIAIPRTFGSNPQYLRSTLKKTDALPSVNLTYQISDEANLRFAYSHSINRPEFRERSTTAYFDFVKYELVGGDTSLQRAFIHNYDVRLEYFPGPGELVAISYFRKAISNAIEERLGFSSTRERKPFNSAYATNAGWEIETRKSLGFLGGYFGNFSVSGNYTRVFSDVSYLVVTPQGYVDAVRPMQAQSPYVINLSILFAEPSLGTSLTVAYNKFGERLEAVGFQTEDIYEQPREAVDVAISKPFLDLFEAKFMIRNLTNKGRVLTRRGALYDRIENGTTYSLQVSFSL
jgi:TonB-dependent receptor